MVDSAFTGGPVHAAVVLNDWLRAPNGNQVIAVVGKVTLVTKEAFGLEEVGSRDSTWALRVQGPQTEMLVLGCQVRIAMTLEPGARLATDYWSLP